MKPLLAHIYEPHRVTFPCYCQPKLNGVRALFQNVNGGSFQSRDEHPFPSRLLQHLAGALCDIFDPSVILDGELYVHGWPLQKINGAVTPVRNEPTEDTLQVEYHIFDIVNFKKPFISRLSEHCLAGDSKGYQFVHTVQALSETHADEWYANWVNKGYEGIMYRLGSCPYTIPKQPIPFGTRIGQTKARFLSDQDNRVWHLLKRKSWQDAEFICVGVEEGEGKYKGTTGSLRCCIAESEISATFTVSSGLTDAERDFYWANPPIGKLVKVRFLCLSQDGIPLNPSILAIL